MYTTFTVYLCVVVGSAFLNGFLSARSIEEGLYTAMIMLIIVGVGGFEAELAITSDFRSKLRCAGRRRDIRASDCFLAGISAGIVCAFLLWLATVIEAVVGANEELEVFQFKAPWILIVSLAVIVPGCLICAWVWLARSRVSKGGAH